MLVNLVCDLVLKCLLLFCMQPRCLFTKAFVCVVLLILVLWILVRNGNVALVNVLLFGCGSARFLFKRSFKWCFCYFWALCIMSSDVI
jgi:hypothetical protein